mmetsp:Transcript_16300/g.24163  ORF Transcript_16300/g.24163 Transcript_16300/m.24163 type:complete len:414 (-) Transcript_16300:11-1252(-)
MLEHVRKLFFGRHVLLIGGDITFQLFIFIVCLLQTNELEQLNPKIDKKDSEWFGMFGTRIRFISIDFPDASQIKDAIGSVQYVYEKLDLVLVNRSSKVIQKMIKKEMDFSETIAQTEEVLVWLQSYDHFKGSFYMLSVFPTISAKSREFAKVLDMLTKAEKCLFREHSNESNYLNLWHEMHSIHRNRISAENGLECDFFLFELVDKLYSEIKFKNEYKGLFTISPEPQKSLQLHGVVPDSNNLGIEETQARAVNFRLDIDRFIFPLKPLAENDKVQMVLSSESESLSESEEMLISEPKKAASKRTNHPPHSSTHSSHSGDLDATDNVVYEGKEWIQQGKLVELYDSHTKRWYRGIIALMGKEEMVINYLDHRGQSFIADIPEDLELVVRARTHMDWDEKVRKRLKKSKIEENF